MVFRFDYPRDINNAALSTISYNGNYTEELVLYLKSRFAFIDNNDYFGYWWPYLNLTWGRDVGPSFIVVPYYHVYYKKTLPLNESLINVNEFVVILYVVGFVASPPFKL